MTHATRVSFELAGLTNEQGRLGESIQTDAVVRPDWARISVDPARQVLVYSTRAPLLSDRQRPEALDQFIRLESADAAQVLRFAQRFGVLSVNAIREEGWYEEELETWRELARRARATLDVAASIRNSEKATEDNWLALRPWYYDWRKRVKSPTPERRRIAERQQLSDVLNAWLRLAEVRPSFSWQTGMNFTNLEGVDEGSITLLGVLALQLVRAVAQGKIATCSGCGATYRRKGREAPKGRANYCPKCGIKAAWRDAQARRRSGQTRKSHRRTK
jgi:hypothetical protein